MNRTIMTLLITTLLSGCGSINARTDKGDSNTYYVGVHSDIAKIKSPGAYDYNYFDLALLFVDVPLSFVADTVYAPFDYYHGPYKKAD
ncbi:YceK/YidQ family lipoprotein [Citrobacter sp. S2-9]|uniref:YceK/YidQ family lipoprotein n=1 Tax=Citrobacter enshiensis TaxID=2971264 RepID=A0ABT8PQP2_9ENTR|nr:YceK/YidQ family lipoprotein [Citrobacter enshiensis]MDN8598368.1 YceK/YidQ family lipoprotein [Citrobacter enshiensis]